MGTLTLPGHRIHVEVAGNGPAILAINGSGSDLRVRPNVLDGPLVRSFTVHTHDHRGLGRSTAPEPQPTMADFADDAAAVLDHFGLERVPVIGVSFGGMVAQELALRHPHRVERLVLCCTSSGGAGGASYPLHELTALSEEESAAVSLSISDVRTREWDDERRRVAIDRLLTDRRAAPAHGDPEARRGSERQLEARRHHDTWDRLPSITAPTLVCAGRHDGIAPPANSEALAGRIPGARLEWYDGGHLFLLQDARAWPDIAAFLAGTPAP